MTSNTERRELILYGYLRDITKILKTSKLIPMHDLYTVMCIYYQIQFKWSQTHKGENIHLSEDESKATFSSTDHSLRAKYPILKDGISSYKCTIHTQYYGFTFIGLVLSDTESFTGATIWDRSLLDFYGIDQRPNVYCYNSKMLDYEGKPAISCGPIESFKLIMKVDDKSYESTVLSFYYQDKLITNASNHNVYTMKLPKIEEEQDWFPCIAFYNSPAWVQIEQNK